MSPSNKTGKFNMTAYQLLTNDVGEEFHQQNDTDA